jgi:hypothetical protein
MPNQAPLDPKSGDLGSIMNLYYKCQRRMVDIILQLLSLFDKSQSN